MVKLSYENLLYLLLGLISLVIIYKLVKSNTSTNNVEGFQSIINKFKNSQKNNSQQNKKNNKNAIKIKKSKLTFDDIVKEAEEMDPGHYTVDNIKKDFFNYIESFRKAKFENVTGTTNEALDKFSLFKDKFFEIFR
jgi:hypothetical protein